MVGFVHLFGLASTFWAWVAIFRGTREVKKVFLGAIRGSEFPLGFPVSGRTAKKLYTVAQPRVEHARLRGMVKSQT